MFLILFLSMNVVGTIIQLIGFFLIFKSFLPDIYDYITKLPYLGKYLSTEDVMKRATQSRTSWTEYPPTPTHPESDSVYF